ncbi:hypothetical protein Tco_0052698 [Tanacetum coccineum]
MMPPPPPPPPLLVVEPNQHDDVPVDPEPVLVDEDEDPKEDEFEEEEDPQEEEDDMESIPTSVHEVGKSSTSPFLRKESDGLLPGLMRMDINSLFGQMASLSRRLCGRETAHALVEKKGKAKDKGELERSMVKQQFLLYEKRRVERDLYWTRVRAHEFYREMIRRGFVFEERPNEAINAPIEDVKSPSIMPPKSAPMTQAAIHRMIKESVDAAIVAERARQANVRNDASGSGPVRGQDTAPAVRECTFAGFMDVVAMPTIFSVAVEGKGKKVKFAATTLEGLALTWWKIKVATMGLETVNQMPWTEMKQLMTVEFCPIEEVQRMKHELMVEPERVKVDAYIRGLTGNIKGEVNLYLLI